MEEQIHERDSRTYPSQELKELEDPSHGDILLKAVSDFSTIIDSLEKFYGEEPMMLMVTGNLCKTFIKALADVKTMMKPNTGVK